jgi:hypothetical protein
MNTKRVKKKIDIFGLAEKNSEYLRTRYKQLNDNCSKSQRALLNDFRETTREKWTLSVNMSDCPLV